MFFVFEIKPFEPPAGISLIYEENTCDRQSTCYQTLLRFSILLREMFSNSIFPRLIENLEKRAPVQVPAVFGTCEHFDSRNVF